MSEPAHPRQRSHPGVPAPRQPFGYEPALDGVRAIAIVGVIVFHTPGWGSFPQVVPGGHMGVTVFFVLSGFLITTLLLGERHRTGTIALRAFYQRRAARLMPGLLLVSVVHTAFWSTEDGFVKTVVPVGAAILYLGSIMAGFWMVMGKITWSWSLSVEEHFYFGWPPLVRWLFGDPADGRPVRGLLRRHPMRAATGCALAVIAVAVALRALFVDSVRWHDMLYYSTFTRMDALAVGCIAALLAWKYRLPLARLAGWSALLVLGYCYLSPSFHIGRPSLNLWGLPLGTAAAAVLVVSLVQRPDSALARMLSVRPLVHVGAVSYGLYLWNLLPGRGLEEVIGHRPGHLATLLSWLAIVVAAELSYRLVERPVQRWVRARMRGERRPLWHRPAPAGPADLAAVTAPNATELTRRIVDRTAAWRVPAVVR